MPLTERFSPRVALLAALISAPVLAATLQAQAPARAPYTVAAGKSVVDSMAATLRARYADADTGAMIAAHLEKRLADGAYARVADWGQFVRLVTQDLQAVNEDTHLFIEVGGPAGGPGDPPPAHGVEAVERLAGNVGYMRMINFGGQAAPAAIVGAMNMLGDTDAMIIDLRNSRGGSPAVANLIMSHFTGPDTTLSLIVFDRVRNTTTPRYTLAQVPGPRRPDVPLFVLTDDVTRSAAEDLAFVLQNMKRATLVGSTTAGAGRNNMGVPLGHGITGSVSFTRVMEPGTRREWERVGVKPDLATHPDSALDVAHREALGRVIGRTSDAAAKKRLELTLEGVRTAQRAKVDKAATPASERFVGTYEGGQTIVVTDGQLVYQPRIAQPRVRLSLVEGNTYAGGSTRYRFALSGEKAGLTVMNADGSASTFNRLTRSVPPRKR